ncbi:MAG: hypothetical protein EKK61_00625 [Rickettsiales bacterium]|nr:MAG: hypothetical protein EKK61_00625 [Rickettsiales bacterium]
MTKSTDNNSKENNIESDKENWKMVLYTPPTISPSLQLSFEQLFKVFGNKSSLSSLFEKIFKETYVKLVDKIVVPALTETEKGLDKLEENLKKNNVPAIKAAKQEMDKKLEEASKRIEKEKPKTTEYVEKEVRRNVEVSFTADLSSSAKPKDADVKNFATKVVDHINDVVVKNVDKVRKSLEEKINNISRVAAAAKSITKNGVNNSLKNIVKTSGINIPSQDKQTTTKDSPQQPQINKKVDNSKAIVAKMSRN